MSALKTCSAAKFWIWGLIVATVLSAAPAMAGMREHMFLPLVGKKVRSGVRLEIESDWVVGRGYMPFKVTVINAPPGPTTYDRDFRIRLTPHGYGSTFNITTEAIVEMPENSTQGSAWVAVPVYSHAHSLHIEVSEGGDRIDELSETLSLNSSGRFWGNQGFSEALPALLVIDRDVPLQRDRETIVQNQNVGVLPKEKTFDLPDVRLWNLIVPQPQNPYNQTATATPGQQVLGDKISDAETLAFVTNNEKVTYLPPAELPDQWLHYTGVDIIFITLDDLQDLVKNSPRQWQAIQDWLRTGPLLIVGGVGDDFAKLSTLEALLKFPKAAPVADEETAWDQHPGWTPAMVGFRDNKVRSLTDIFNANQGYYTPGAQPNLPGLESTMQGIPADEPPFAIREFGLGKVAAITSPEMINDPPLEMAWLLNQVGSRTWMQYQRQGVSYARQNSDFMTFLIEGTGRVPVMSFVVLITLFVIVIGPINYLLLRRWKRLFVLLVTVPVGAGIVTLALFGYALVSDGLGVQTRNRSLTHLDQRSGKMECWARQSYYAGLSPSGGLKYPLDSAVFPIEERPWSNNSGSGRSRTLVWTDDEQQLRSGYLRSREPAQFLVVRSAASQKKIALEVPQSGELTATNQLGVKIVHLVARNRDGNYFQGSDLAAGGKQKLQPVSDFNSAVMPMSMAYNNARPSLPLGYETSSYSMGLFGFREGYGYNYYYRSDYDSRIPSPSFQASILEMELRRATVSNQELEPGSYFALVDQSPEMPLGYARVTERGSFHAVLGHW